MNDIQLKNVLKRMNLPTFNCSIKKSFLNAENTKCVGAFTRELNHDLYIFDNVEDILYKYPREKRFKVILRKDGEFANDRWAIPVELMEQIGTLETLPSSGEPLTPVSTMKERAIPATAQNTGFGTVLRDDGIEVELEDAPMTTMTLRDYACIRLQVPESGKEWLNSIIRHSKQTEV